VDAINETFSLDIKLKDSTRDKDDSLIIGDVFIKGGFGVSVDDAGKGLSTSLEKKQTK
jgi:hypothetical protein